MDIRPIAAAYGAKPFESVAKSDKKAAPEKTAAAPQSEQVEISDASFNMQKLKEIIDATPQVRIKVVEDIKTKIKYNGYPIESNIYKAIENLVTDHIIWSPFKTTTVTTPLVHEFFVPGVFSCFSALRNSFLETHNPIYNARVVELVDTRDLKSLGT